MDLGFFPYGNAQESKNPDGTWNFSCQHGESECLGNMIEACAMKYHNSTSDWFPFVNCIEASNLAPGNVAGSCAKAQRWTDYDTSITTCVKGAEGNALMHTIAQATANLQPAHTFTPWIVLNGKPLSSAQLDQELTKVVCDAYTGTKPAGCSAKKSVSEKLCSA